MPANLYLFDIDGTLLRGGTGVHRASFAHVAETVYGVEASLDGIPAGGRTDSWLLREMLRRAVVSDECISTRLLEAFHAMQEYAEAYLGDLRAFVLPGVPDVLAGLRDHGQLLGLLTGNLSRIAWAKMHHAGLDGFFQGGGFGEESPDRPHLVPVALADMSRIRGAPIPPDRAAIVGDTPLDIEAGQAHGLKTAGVATGYPSEEELRLAGADLVLPSFADPERAVGALLGLFAA